MKYHQRHHSKLRLLSRRLLLNHTLFRNQSLSKNPGHTTSALWLLNPPDKTSERGQIDLPLMQRETSHTLTELRGATPLDSDNPRNDWPSSS